MSFPSCVTDLRSQLLIMRKFPLDVDFKMISKRGGRNDARVQQECLPESNAVKERNPFFLTFFLRVLKLGKDDQCVVCNRLFLLSAAVNCECYPFLR